MQNYRIPLQAMIVIILLITVTAFAGCGQKNEVNKGEQITVTDIAGRQVILKVPVERVVTTFNFEGYIAVAGQDAFKKIVGWTRGYWEGRRQWIWEKYTNAFPEIKDIPDVGYTSKGTFSAEKVIALNPDVVIMAEFEKKKAETAIKQLEQAGIPVIFIDYHAQTLKNHIKSTLLLGKVLGKEKRAQEIVDFYQEQVNKVYSRLEKIDKQKPTVYVEGGWNGPSTYGNSYGNYMWGALIEKCGGINIAKGKIERWGPLNPEYVLKTNPDVIIITGSYWPKNPDSMRLGYYANLEESKELLKNFTKRPGWENLNAVKNNRVYSIHHGLSRQIYDFVSVQAFAKWFYPEEFKDLDPEESFKEFHKRFLPVDYSGVWMMSIKD